MVRIIFQGALYSPEITVDRNEFACARYVILYVGSVALQSGGSTVQTPAPLVHVHVSFGKTQNSQINCAYYV